MKLYLTFILLFVGIFTNVAQNINVAQFYALPNALDARLDKYTPDVKQINVKLQNGKEIEITTNIANADLYIDSTYIGKTPVKVKLAYGKHAVKLNFENKVIKDFIEISQSGKTSFTFNFAGDFENYTETVAGVSFDMIAIKGGTFTMGNPDGNAYEKPTHQVTVSDFYMGKYEVSNEEICVFLTEKGNQTEGGTTWFDIESSACKIEKSGSRFISKSGYAKHPVVKFSWYGATAYCKWLSQKTGKTYSLPSEAQWEYAAGGGSSNRTKWAGTNSENSLGDYAWYKSNSGSKTHQVGTKKANQLGLHDMNGNVWEWCEDKWHYNYENAPKDGTAWLRGTSSIRVDRGGSWGNLPAYCRSAYRGSINPEIRDFNIGFRLMCVP